MKILALDLGSHTGWVYGDTDGGLLAYGTSHFAPSRYEGGGVRFLRFRKFLDEFEPGLVVYEEVGFVRNVQASEVLHGFRTILMTRYEEEGIPYQGVPVGTLKKFATGKGNSGKDVMALAFQESLAPWVLTRNLITREDPESFCRRLDDNTIDAFWVWKYAETHLVPAHAGRQ